MPAHLLERGEQLVRARTGVAEHLRRLAALGGKPDQQVLGRDVLVGQVPGPLRGGRQRREQRREVSGALSVAPAARGSRPISSLVLLATAAGSAPAARSSGTAIPPS